MKINQNFLGGRGGCKTKKPSVEGVWIFSGTAQYKWTQEFGLIIFDGVYGTEQI